MPAIQLDRLKTQVAALGEQFAAPEAFLRALSDLLDYYADRTLRQGAGSRPPMLLPQSAVAPQVLRQVEAELSRRAPADVPAAAELCDRLWAAGTYESRLLAVHLIGELARLRPEGALTRVLAWTTPEENPLVLEMLLTSGKTRLPHEHPDLWLALAGRWLADDRPAYQAIGLRALRALVENPQFANLPAAFDALDPLLKAAPPSLHPELVQVISSLAARSPSETVFALRHAIAVSPEESLPRLVRRCLPIFDPPTQERLRQTLRERTRGQ